MTQNLSAQRAIRPGTMHASAGRYTGWKKAVLLVAALSQFSMVLLSDAAMAQAVSQTIASTALPTGGTVRAGAATLTQGGTAGNPSLTINQTTNRAAIDWSTFNIGSASAVQFVQPDATSSTLNRVLDTNASQIFGRLTSNGQVFLMNPNGVIFGASASVDVGGLVATTHALSNEDYMAGKTTFTRNGATGKIINEGTLTSRLGGYIALLAPEVRNNGVIIARAGTLKGKLVSNTGTVSANGGTAGVTNGVVTDPTVKGKGGTVKLLGDQVGLFGNSFVSASGMTGGGTVLIGGDWQGGNGVPQSRQVFMGSDTRIDASALYHGHGGKVVLWSTDWTGFYGSIKATGGSQGGDGGKVETSSHKTLQAWGALDLNAPKGKGGQWLVDPADLHIVKTGTTNISASVTDFTMTDPNAPSTLGVALINGNLDLGNTVTITASGTLYLDSGVTIGKTTANSASLILNANSVQFNGNIDSSRLLNVTVNTTDWLNGTGNINTKGGLLTINLTGVGRHDGVIYGGGNTLVTGGGSMTLGGQVDGTGSLTVNAGTLTLTGTHSYTGDTIISGTGTLVMGTGGSLATGTKVDLQSATSTWDLGSTDKFISGLTGVAGSRVLLGGTSTQKLEIMNTTDMTFAGVISGAGSVSQTGSSTTTLSGTNSYTGATNIDNGTLKMGATGTLSNLTAVNVASGAVFDVNGTSQTIGSLAGVANTFVLLGAGSLTAGSNGTSTTYAGTMSGTASSSFTKAGSGTMTLSGDNPALLGSLATAASGGTLIVTGANDNLASVSIGSNSTLQIGNGGATGSLGSTAITDSGTLAVVKSGTTTLANVISGTGQLSVADGTFVSTVTGTISQGSVQQNAGGDLTVNAALVTTGDSQLQTGGTLTLNAGVSSPDGNLVLQTAHFVNNVGASGLTVGAGKTWQVWSTNADPFNTDPAIGDKRNGLAFDFKQYGATYGTSTVLGTGNGLFYAITPMLDVSLTGTVVKTYDGTVSASLTAGNYAYAGALDGDVGIFTATTGAVYADKNAGSAIGVSINGSLTGARSSAATGSKAVYGYVLNNRTSLSNTIGTVNKANATVTANSGTVTYNGQTQTVSGFTASGLVGGETASVLTGVTASGSGMSPGIYATKASGVDQNYNLAFVDGQLKINQSSDNGAVVKDIVFKTTNKTVISELKVQTICEPSNGTYVNLVALKSCQ